MFKKKQTCHLCFGGARDKGLEGGIGDLKNWDDGRAVCDPNEVWGWACGRERCMVMVVGEMATCEQKKDEGTALTVYVI